MDEASNASLLARLNDLEQKLETLHRSSTAAMLAQLTTINILTFLMSQHALAVTYTSRDVKKTGEQGLDQAFHEVDQAVSVLLGE